jgi:hypothetical protein
MENLSYEMCHKKIQQWWNIVDKTNIEIPFDMSKTNLFSFSQTFGDSNKLQNRSKLLEAKTW